MGNLLSIQGLKTYFKTARGTIKAVDGMALEIDEKESVGLVGESGCGKTMTARSIMGLVPPPGETIEGRIMFKHKNLLELPEEDMRAIRGAEISMVFQDPMTYLNPVWKVGDQIAEAIMLHQDKDKRSAKKTVIDTLKMVGMPSPEKIVDYYPFQLSGGMRQRILLAIAISCNPSLLIADEPTTALDVTIQMQILNLIKQLINEFGISLLLITHDLGIVADTCDRVYVMYGGKIVETADVFNLYDSPMHPYTMGLLKGVLSIDEYKEKLETIGGFVPDPINLPSGCRFHPRCQHIKTICRRKEPLLTGIDSGHAVSCWLYERE